MVFPNERFRRQGIVNSMKRNPATNAWIWTGLTSEAALAAMCCTVLVGCGQSSTPTQAKDRMFDAPAEVRLLEIPDDVVSPLKPVEQASGQTAMAEMANDDKSGDAIQQVSAVRSDKSAPVALMAEIGRLRSAPVDVVRQPRADAPGEFDEIQLTPEQAAKERVRRLYKTVDLSMQVIGKTYRDPQHQQEFGNAVLYLCESRIQLYFAGDEEQAVLLQKDADVLFKQDPTSFATIESNYKVLQLTQALAERSSRESRWVSAFARQSRIFAERCPQETSRATTALSAAAKMCGELELTEEAQQCYEVLKARYPDSPFATQGSAAALK